MRTKNYLQSKMHHFGILLLALVLTSCGSYQYAGYEEDPIYGDDRRTVEYPSQNQERVVAAEEKADEDNGYYSNYFKEKALQYEGMNEDDVIFTDIDSYEGSYAEEQDSTEYRGGYGGWGQDNNDDIVINVYGGHMFNSIWWNRPWGWGWNNWGWNAGWGWNNWGWNAGWGWGGWNHWDPFWCPPIYGIGWNRPWWGGGFYGYGWNGFYGNGYGYYNRRVAFVNSRRDALSTNSSLAGLSRRSSVNSNTVRRGSNMNSTVRRGTTARNDVRTRPTSRTRPSVNTNSRTRPSNTTTRPNTSRNRPKVDSRTRPNSNQRYRPNSNQRYRPNTTSRSRPTTTSRSNRRTYNNRSGGTSRPSGVSRGGGSRSYSGGGRSGGVSRGGGGRRGGRM